MIYIRLVTVEDSKAIFEWRNDPQTRKMSKNSRYIQWNEHERWLKLSLQNSKKRFLMCLDEFNSKIGVTRFDIKKTFVEVSINISPQKRGKGYSKHCLKKSIKFFQNIYPKQKLFKAEIKDINMLSQKSFEGVGFEFDFKIGNVSYYSMKT